MNNLQKVILKVEEILNKNKNLFDEEIEYIEIEYIKSNMYNIKSKIEIWKKLKNKSGLIYINYFHVYKNETYEEATNNFIDLINN